jgi:ATP-binding cassette subfamily G (WHITE) protein 1
MYSAQVVTTIHQPSSRLLGYFDHLYIVASGFCIYQGPVRHLVPYFQSMNLNCPSYHNPIDFGNAFIFVELRTSEIQNIANLSIPCKLLAMDVACGQYGTVLADLVSGVKNGRLNFQDSSKPSSSNGILILLFIFLYSYVSFVTRYSILQ